MIQIGMHAGRAGGADRYFDGLCQSFSDMGVPYRGFVFEGDAETLRLPVGTNVLGSSEASLHNRLRMLRVAVNQRLDLSKPELLVSHFALYSGPLLYPVNRYCHKIMHVSHFHGPWADESAIQGASKLSIASKRLIERWVYRSSVRVITDSDAFRRLAIESYGLNPHRVVAVPAAINAWIFAHAASMPRHLAREHFDWPKKRKVVFCLRRLTRRMGLDRLIEAWRAVIRIEPQALLVIGGTGPLREELEDQVYRHSLDGHVLFTGFIAEQDLPIAYRAADFSVVPSTTLEGFGLVILESLAVGTPVLVTPIGGMPEIIGPLQSELILKDASTAELEQGLVNLLTDKLPAPPEQECIEYVLKNYNWRLAAERILKVYASACTAQ